MINYALTIDQVTQYKKVGFISPIDVLPPSEAARLCQQFEELEQRDGGKLAPQHNQKPHLLLTWLNRLIRDPRILDRVESILGENILCWNSGFFVKNGHDPSRVTWHQDSTYWGLSQPDVVTAWLALTPSTIESGCMRVIPRTHTSDQLPHRDTFARDNLLTRGQEVTAEVDESQAVDVELEPGQMSLHHVRIVHGSEPNRASFRRIGFAIRYVPTYVKQVANIRDGATLVRGVDSYGHFVLEPAPESDFAPNALAFHAQAFETFSRIVYSDAAQKSK